MSFTASLHERQILSPDGGIVITVAGNDPAEVDRLALICASAPAALVMLKDLLAWAERAHQHAGCHLLRHAREAVAWSEGRTP